MANRSVIVNKNGVPFPLENGDVLKIDQDVSLKDGKFVFTDSGLGINSDLNFLPGKSLNFMDGIISQKLLTVKGPSNLGGSNRSITLPAEAPTNDYLVKTDSSGNWSYVAPPASGGRADQRVVNANSLAAATNSNLLNSISDPSPLYLSAFGSDVIFFVGHIDPPAAITDGYIVMSGLLGNIAGFDYKTTYFTEGGTPVTSNSTPSTDSHNVYFYRGPGTTGSKCHVEGAIFRNGPFINVRSISSDLVLGGKTTATSSIVLSLEDTVTVSSVNFSTSGSTRVHLLFYR